MTEQVQAAPALPVLPQGYFSDSQVRADHWKATVAAFEAAQGDAAPGIGVPGNTPAGAVAPTVTPHVDDLSFLSEVTKAKRADGKLHYFESAATRANVEAWRTKVFAGERIPREVIEATRAAMRGEQPAPAATAPEAAPTPPTGSPAEREQARLDALADRLDAGESVPASELPEAAFSGYKVELPPLGYGRRQHRTTGDGTRGRIHAGHRGRVHCGQGQGGRRMKSLLMTRRGFGRVSPLSKLQAPTQPQGRTSPLVTAVPMIARQRRTRVGLRGMAPAVLPDRKL